ncbi:MAG: hypothetical protein M3167_02460 [Acidobacteriota bacterium]|nr:hypothetical protein [Acidobacteriota bacterium]
MSNRATEILTAIDAKPDPALGDVFRFCQSTSALGSEWICDGLAVIRKYLQLPSDVGGRRCGPEFFEVVIGHGEAGCRALLDSFVGSLGPDPATAGRRPIEAFLHVVRLARIAAVISWDLTGWRLPSDPASTYLLTLPVELHDRLRTVAAAAGLPMVAFVRSGVEEMIARAEQAIENRKRPVEVPVLTVKKPRRRSRAGGRPAVEASA